MLIRLSRGETVELDIVVHPFEVMMLAKGDLGFLNHTQVKRSIIGKLDREGTDIS